MDANVPDLLTFYSMRMLYMKHFNYLFIFLFFNVGAATGQHKIDFNIKNYQNDTLVIGYYLLDKQLVQDTLISKNKKFELSGDENLPSGTYMLLTLPDQEFIQFLVSPIEQKFSLTFDINNKEKIAFKNAPDNQAFQDYVDFLMVKRPEANILRDTIQKLKEAEKDTEYFESQLAIIDKEVKLKQEDLIKTNPNFVSSKMIKVNTEINVPDFSDLANPGQAKYEYYKSHYFDYLDFTDPSALRSPYLYQRVNYYIEKLTMHHPDSVAHSLDDILHKMEPAPETFKYYLSHMLNKYSASKVVGFDAVYVHLVDEYYSKGKTPWVEEENLEKIIDRANKVRPTLIGKIGHDCEFYLEDGSPLKISDIEYEYLVLLFWAPDCGHCKKAMPDFVAFNSKWKDKGVKTLAVCSKLGEKEKDCWEMLEEKDMLGFINVSDKMHKSKYKVHYNVSKTPKVFVLDANREILIKDIGGDQLESVMDEIIRIEKEDAGAN